VFFTIKKAWFGVGGVLSNYWGVGGLGVWELKCLNVKIDV
jgi:hypothetical protein